MRSLGVFKISVPVRERVETEHPASGNIPARKTVGWTTTGYREVEVDVRVDALALAQTMGPAAAKAKRRKSVEAGGLVEVVVVKEAL